MVNNPTTIISLKNSDKSKDIREGIIVCERFHVNVCVSNPTNIHHVESSLGELGS